MEENKQDENKAPVQIKSKKESLPEVITIRNAKEYLGESLLIIFSVVLALLLTELFSKIHENNRTEEIIQQLKQELIDNKKAEEIQYAYHVQVLRKIDSALTHSEFAKQFINNGVLNLKSIAPDGIRRIDLNDIAWQIAKENNILSKLDINISRMLTHIYDQQQHITKSEDEIAKVLLSWESRKPENLQTTLILTSDNYKGWAVDRAPGLLKEYQEAIDKLGHY
jgi:hypothetical protein